METSITQGDLFVILHTQDGLLFDRLPMSQARFGPRSANRVGCIEDGCDRLAEGAGRIV